MSAKEISTKIINGMNKARYHHDKQTHIKARIKHALTQTVYAYHNIPTTLFYHIQQTNNSNTIYT